MPADDLITASEVAAILGVPAATVRSWTCRGQLPAYRISDRLTRYSKSEIEQWIAARRIGTAAPPDELAGARAEIRGRAAARKASER